MRLKELILSALLVLAAAPAFADPVTLNFDGLTDGTAVNNQFQGVSFSNATVITAGVTLNELEFPPRSGGNVIFNDGGPLTITFATPTASFEAYSTYTLPVTLTAFDANGNQVGTVTSQFTSNLALSGAAGSSPNELLSLTASGGISRIVISAGVGGAFVLDDAKFGGSVSPVPEPASLSLILGGLALLGATKRHRH